MLHIINSSPAQTTALQSCLSRIRSGSALLLIENGVYAALKSDINDGIWRGLPSEVRLFVLESDLDARGLSKEAVDGRFVIVDYAGFVDLAEQSAAAQSWV